MPFFAHINVLRLAELDLVAPFFPPGSGILEIGAGSGEQAVELARRGFRVSAVEVAGSVYAEVRAFPILDYDGSTLPFPDATFDVVFSSNVLEHVPDLSSMHSEIRRVLKPSGHCVHVLPTHMWRFWTTLAAFPAALVSLWAAVRGLVASAATDGSEVRKPGYGWRHAAAMMIAAFWQPRHGERGNVLTELWFFHPRWWRKNFDQSGLGLIRDQEVGLFYTGHQLLGPRLSVARRRQLARWLGSACHVYQLGRDPK
jgi:SAM-dependent methyltransferase